MSLFASLQQDAANLLIDAPFFSDAGAQTPLPIPVVWEVLRDIQNQISLAVGKQGIVTCLMTVSGRQSNPNMSEPFFEDIKLVARTYENVMVNRASSGTGQSAALVAEACAQLLHRWFPPGLKAALFCTDVMLVDSPKLYTWDAIFKLKAGLGTSAPVRQTC